MNRVFSPDDPPGMPNEDPIIDELRRADAEVFEREQETWEERFSQEYPDATPGQIKAAWLAYDAHDAADSPREPVNAYVAKPGRPRVGTDDAQQALKLIEQRVDPTHLQVVGKLGRGRPPAHVKAAREALEIALGEIRAKRLATIDALARALGVDQRTIERLARQ